MTSELWQRGSRALHGVSRKWKAWGTSRKRSQKEDNAEEADGAERVLSG